MRTLDQSRDVVVVGRACRLPGASSVEELWSNLIEGRCSVTSIPPDRWSLDKHGHPRPKEPGKSYVWAAGVLDDVWSFDPAAFGISPREAEQMDPQQRLMLELTWEALENAGITRSSVAGGDVGVFVGASSTEYQNIRNSDMAGGDAYTATGGALSIISNRISHAFDFKGPSFTVDTACSSSLVALHQAMEALRSDRIDTAIVGGVNLLLSPFGFVVFSQASMLSPAGLCRTFDAKADGYVRAEGGVVLVLKTQAKAVKDDARMYARLVASGVNSDGRTNGIALPSRFAQAQLLRDVYSGAGIKPSELAFVEAHGTGTRVGDPIEAHTIGDVLGRERTEPLPIGSIKSNIGHLEPASGLAGILKVMLAFEHDVLPPSINYDEPNPDIAFDELKLEVCTRPLELPRGDGPRYAGVNSFGFGGTNAHVVVADVTRRPVRARRSPGNSDLFAISAATKPVVLDLARRYAERLSSATPEETQDVVAAAVHRRELMTERAVVEWGSPRDLVRKLERIADREDDVPGVTWGSATEANAPVAFVFSGNGGQWPGMGRGAYGSNRRFRETFDEVDALFDKDFGWSITEALFAADLEQRLQFTHVAQPMIFAIQIATSRALAAQGLEPSVVIGHSVGEIAAAAISGGLSLRAAVQVIHARSAHQEIVRGAGRMAVLVGSLDSVLALADEVGGVEIAAYNSPRTFTVAGATDRVAALGALARKRRVVFRQLDLDYPFHCDLIGPVREPLLRDLKGLKPATPRIEMISTVTGEALGGLRLDADYWWRNVREPVRFSSALEHAARGGARVFVEIGPRSVLLSNIAETLETTSLPFAALGVLERRESGDDKDPIRPAAISAFARGAAVDLEKLFGPEPTRPVSLPTYPWARRDMRSAETAEAIGYTLDSRWHRLLGARHTLDGVEWLNQLDTTVLPELADHEVGGHPILPAAAFIEMALQVGRDWFGTDRAAILELDIVQALPLEADRTKEIKARFSPLTNTLEILSRPRLSKAGWRLHAIARLTEECDEDVHATVADRSPGPDATTGGDEIYRAAEAVGLRYGPAFRLLASVERAGSRQILVDLKPSAPSWAYGLDPARLDACFHGLFVLFRDLGAEGRSTAYIPVRFGHIRLLAPGAVPVRALIDIGQAGERAIVADLTLFDEGGRPVAQLQDCRFQAAKVRRPNVLADKALRINTVAIDGGALGRTGLELTSAAVTTALLELCPAEIDGPEPVEELLMAGWAAAASFELASSFAADGLIATDAIAALPDAGGAWLTNLLRSLEESGLATPSQTGWSLAAESLLPSSGLILRTLAADHPHRSAELLLAASFTERGATGGANQQDVLTPPSTAAVDGYELGGASVRRAGELLETVLAKCEAFAQPGLRVLQVGYGPFSQALSQLAHGREAQLTILETDRRRLERGKLALTHRGATSFVDAAQALPDAGFDLVVSAHGLRHAAQAGGLAEIRRAVAPGGFLVAVEPPPSLFADLVLGLTPGWFDPEGSPEFPLGPLRSVDEWTGAFEDGGFEDVAVTSVASHDDTAIVIAAGAPAVAMREVRARSIVIQADRSGRALKLAQHLDATLAMDGHHVHNADPGGVPSASGQPIDTVLHLLERATGASDLAALRDGCLAIKHGAEACLRAKAEFWIIVAATGSHNPLADPVVAGILAFSRTLANEAAALIVRRVCVAARADDGEVSRALGGLIGNAQAETDFLIGPEGVRVLRVGLFDELRPAVEAGSTAGATGARLERGSAGGLGALTWRAAERPEPGAGEVEIAVEASALNFRDVMWAMSLLPDDILEDGFAGPTLGLECAGRVVRVGADVDRFRAGDRVLSFAPSAFAKTVSVPANVVAPVPADWSIEAAASVPVAFLTAYYGLVTLANLKAGEWVLIHGAAGGVGLAAVQIAQWRGATVVATAGSAEKRKLLQALGVEHILNSRSAAFADDIRRIRSGGVDVVLNSLSGEAMERGLSTLKAFGRFIELGKRDYVANTRIGLRPFRRNLSYFGVDVDQLLSDRDRASEIFGEVMRLFEAGDLKPLPYRVFSAGETVDAFRLMQQSGHIGKILLRPPAEPVAAARPEPFRFDPERTHLITGGFGGFGLEAARWLADAGVKHLVLVGRSGPASDEARALVDDLARRGVDLRALRCDIADESAVADVLAEIDRTMPPLSGILHAAMVLEDGLISDLTGEQLTKVLAPKVEGAVLLDRLTQGRPLDYFVMFSSITTVIGNPGQGAYVAANGYLEGLARARRERGEAGLALAWGAIADVGVLARSKGLAEALSKRVGVKAMPARDALDLMAQALAETGRDPDRAVLAVGSLDWSAARRLPALGSPTFAALTRDGSVADAVERRSIDLKALVGAQDPETVRKQVVEVIVEEIATVLRVPKQDVSLGKRLAEIGLDSLMAIELASALQDRFELDAPPTGSVGALTVAGLGDHLISFVHAGAPDEEIRVTQALNDRHAGVEMDAEALSPLLQAVQARSRDLKGLMT